VRVTSIDEICGQNGLYQVGVAVYRNFVLFDVVEFNGPFVCEGNCYATMYSKEGDTSIFSEPVNKGNTGKIVWCRVGNRI
jgi:hypothetical protein